MLVLDLIAIIYAILGIVWRCIVSVSAAQKRATIKYVKAKYDRHVLTMPKGHKAILQAHVKKRGESLNGFINRAIDEAMARDSAEESTT